jgi:hypothetical protein
LICLKFAPLQAGFAMTGSGKISFYSNIFF